MVLVAPRHTVQEHFEERRDYWWRREGTRQIDSVYAAERFIEEVGFASCMTDSRRPGPSLYVAVCGRRDAVMPRNVQKDPESSLTWTLKDELLARGPPIEDDLALRAFGLRVIEHVRPGERAGVHRDIA